MMNLFLVYLGGRTPKSNIELHDVQFVAGETIEETYETLRARWFGTRKGLHLDSYAILRFVDGFRIELRKEPFAGQECLYFINFGGYDPSQIAELHQFGLFVATNPDEAKRRAKKELVLGSALPHKDDMFDIDDCFTINDVGEYFVHLFPDTQTQKLKPDWFGYNVIGK